MKKNFLAVSALALGVAALAAAQPAPTKVGIIFMADAIQGTAEGKKAGEALEKKFQPKQTDLEKRQAEITQMQTQLRNGSAALSEEKKKQLTNDIDTATKRFNRDREDAQAEMEADSGKIMQELGVKLVDVVTKYATDNAFAVILDVSNPQTPVVWSAAAVNITEQVVKAYDAKYPVAGAAPAAAPAKPAVTPTSAPKPGAAAPPVKK